MHASPTSHTPFPHTAHIGVKGVMKGGDRRQVIHRTTCILSTVTVNTSIGAAACNCIVLPFLPHPHVLEGTLLYDATLSNCTVAESTVTFVPRSMYSRAAMLPLVSQRPRTRTVTEAGYHAEAFTAKYTIHGGQDRSDRDTADGGWSSKANNAGRMKANTKTDTCWRPPHLL
jgi:hypothetical protein